MPSNLPVLPLCHPIIKEWAMEQSEIVAAAPCNRHYPVFPIVK